MVDFRRAYGTRGSRFRSIRRVPEGPAKNLLIAGLGFGDRRTSFHLHQRRPSRDSVVGCSRDPASDRNSGTNHQHAEIHGGSLKAASRRVKQPEGVEGRNGKTATPHVATPQFYVLGRREQKTDGFLVRCRLAREGSTILIKMGGCTFPARARPCR